MKDNNLVLDALSQLILIDSNEVYKIFQTPRNYRKKIKKIKFNLIIILIKTANLNDIKIDDLLIRM